MAMHGTYRVVSLSPRGTSSVTTPFALNATLAMQEAFDDPAVTEIRGYAWVDGKWKLDTEWNRQ